MSTPTKAPAPHLTLDVEYKGTTTIVRCHGKLVSGVTDVLYSNVTKLVPGSKRIILDLTDLAFMDSMGLGTLMRLYVHARANGCTLELINIGKRIRDLLELTNIWSVFATVGEHGIKL
jgi:anti-sigma B factor antagonist